MTVTDAKVAVVNPLRSADWNKMLLGSGQSTIFHSANWARLLAESYGYHPAYFTLSEQGAFRGCLPIMEVKSALTGRRGVCLSFSDCCGAVVEGAAEFRLLFDSVLELGRLSGWRYVEFRGEPFLGQELPAKAYAHHSIALSGDEHLMHSRLRKGTASSIKKAEKEGVSAEISSSLEAVRDFYRLHCLTRRRHGLPPQPGSFFDKLHEHVISQGLGFVALARHGKDTVLLWETIKTCANQGMRSMSLGRTDLGNEGLLTFKNGWGAERTVLNYYRYDFASSGFVCDKERDLSIFKKVLKTLPVDVLKFIGQLAYRHMG
jgi:hypothetical protein